MSKRVSAYICDQYWPNNVCYLDEENDVMDEQDEEEWKQVEKEDYEKKKNSTDESKTISRGINH